MNSMLPADELPAAINNVSSNAHWAPQSERCRISPLPFTAAIPRHVASLDYAIPLKMSRDDEDRILHGLYYYRENIDEDVQVSSEQLLWLAMHPLSEGESWKIGR